MIIVFVPSLGAEASVEGEAVDVAVADGVADAAARAVAASAARAVPSGSADVEPKAPIVADGPTEGTPWASAGLITHNANPAANAEQIAPPKASGRRGRLVETPTALMLHHAPLVAKLFQMRAN